MVVDEKEGAPEVDADEVLLIDDWRLTQGAQIAGGLGNMHDWSHAGRIGNWITVNGEAPWVHSTSHLSRLRLRLVNTANARIFNLAAVGLEGWVVALDGMPLSKPAPLGNLTLAPAQRADLIVDVTADEGGQAFLVSYERDNGHAIAAFPVSGKARTVRMPAPSPLPSSSVPDLTELATARSARLVMEGGAMGRMPGAMVNGRMTDMRGLVSVGKAWAFSGAVDMPDEPLVDVARGETVRITIGNDTAWPHAMHLHGHHFRQVMSDTTLGPLRDTLLLDRGETTEIAFVADNPGDWLLHCHMLEHVPSGMMTWLRVT